MCLFLHLFSKFLNKLHTVLRIIVVFHWIYRPFIYLKSFFFKIPNHLLEKKIIYTFYLFGGKTERNEVSKWKHWKFNIAIEGIYFFFCISDNRPWHFPRWRVYVLLGWTFPCYFLLSQAKEVLYASPRTCSSFQIREEPLTHFKKRFCLFLALQKETMVLKTL